MRIVKHSVQRFSAASLRLRAPKLDIEYSGILLQFWRKSHVEALLTGTPEGSVFWEYDVPAVLTNLPFVFQNSHGSELPFRNAVRAAWHLRLIRWRHSERSPIQTFAIFLTKQLPRSNI
jgi:hypothetical protein